MSEREELLMLTGFGNGPSTARILAVQPDEFGEEEWPLRTFVFGLQGPSLGLLETLPTPIDESWMSANCATYCPTNNGKLMRHVDGRWSSFQVCHRNEEFGAVIGFSGSTPEQDQLMICGSVSTFAGSTEKGFTEIAMPNNVEEVWRLHGLTPSEVYICTDAGLMLWDGHSVRAIDGPDDEIFDVLVLSPTELIAVGEDAHRWVDGKGWSKIRSAVKDLAQGMCLYQNQVMLPGLDGVGRLEGNEIKRLAKFSSNQLIACGETLMAAGSDGGLSIFNGTDWVRIKLPKLAPGEVL